MDMVVLQSISTNDGASLAATDTVSVEAYDKITVAVPQGAADLEVELQPDTASAAKALFITSNVYQNGLSYKVHDVGTTKINLDHPQLYLGVGQVGVLEDVPSKLFFTNGGAAVTVTIIVGRDATP